MEDYGDIAVHLNDPVITDSDIDTYIGDILIDYDQKSLTLDFVKREFDVNSIEEFNQYCKEKVTDSKELQILIKARNDVLNSMIGKCEFSLDKYVVSKYSLDVVKFYEDQAYLSDMELEYYVDNILNMSKDDFYTMCYED